MHSEALALKLIAASGLPLPGKGHGRGVERKFADDGVLGSRSYAGVCINRVNSPVLSSRAIWCRGKAISSEAGEGGLGNLIRVMVWGEQNYWEEHVYQVAGITKLEVM